MDDPATAYIKIVLDVSVAAIITLVLFILARRARKEQTFVGFKARSLDEKYAGYSLFAVGLVIILIAAYELIILLNGGSLAGTAFNFSSTSIFGQLVTGQLLGLIFGVDFWVTIIFLGGRKLMSLGLDLLNGKKAVLRIKN